MERVRSALALALVACSVPLSQRPREPGTIVGRAMYNDYWSWSAAPWFRPSAPETEYPVFLLIDQRGYACRVDAGDWVLVAAGELYACPSWIRPRNRVPLPGR